MTRRQYNLHNFPLFLWARRPAAAPPLGNPSAIPAAPRFACARVGASSRKIPRAWYTECCLATLGCENTLGRSPRKNTRMTLTIKLDRNWSSFQLANSAPPLSVTDSAIAPSARMHNQCGVRTDTNKCNNVVFVRTLCAHTQHEFKHLCCCCNLARAHKLN